MIVDPPNGQLPALTPAAEAAARAQTRGTFGPGPFDDFDDFSLYDRCITRGVIGSMLPVIYGNGVRITQNPESVAISYEMIHDTRIIPLDGRPALDNGIRQWMGSARGRFEGDTLVIETTNFTDRTSVGSNGGGVPNTEQLKLTERLTRIDPAMIEYVATVDDPGAFTAPWSLRVMITSRPGYEVLEYSCHEGNGAVAHSLCGERVYEQQVAEAKAKGLADTRARGQSRANPQRSAGRRPALLRHQRRRVAARVMRRAFDVVMRVVTSLIGLLMILSGAVWMMQGFGVGPAAIMQGFMVNDIRWTYLRRDPRDSSASPRSSGASLDAGLKRWKR